MDGRIVGSFRRMRPTRVPALRSAFRLCSTATSAWQRTLDSATDADAMYRVAEAYLEGTGGAPMDAAAGRRWLKDAAELGHAPSQARLGQLAYDELEALRALSNVHDYQAAGEAERWLKLASAQGERQATRTLLTFYASHGNVFATCGTLVTWLRGG